MVSRVRVLGAGVVVALTIAAQPAAAADYASTARNIVPSNELGQRLADLTNVKYKHYGMTNTVETYAGGIWTLRAERVLAWNLLYEDATRFRFD